MTILSFWSIFDKNQISYFHVLIVSLTVDMTHYCSFINKDLIQLFLLLYFDDIILSTSSSDHLRIISTMLGTQFSMIALRELNYFFGTTYIRDHHKMFLSQRKYALESLKRSNMLNFNPYRTIIPIDTCTKLHSFGLHIDVLSLCHNLVGVL